VCTLKFVLSIAHGVQNDPNSRPVLPVGLISGIPQLFQLFRLLLGIASPGLHASTGHVQGMTSCDLLTISAVSGNNNFWTRGRVKVACHFPFWERKFYVIFALGSESTRGRKFHGTKVPGNESYTHGTFAPGSESTWERKFQLPNTYPDMWYHNYGNRSIRGQTNSRTGQVADKSFHGLVSSWTNQVADWSTRALVNSRTQRINVVFQSRPPVDQSATSCVQTNFYEF